MMRIHAIGNALMLEDDARVASYWQEAEREVKAEIENLRQLYQNHTNPNQRIRENELFPVGDLKPILPLQEVVDHETGLLRSLPGFEAAVPALLSQGFAHAVYGEYDAAVALVENLGRLDDELLPFESYEYLVAVVTVRKIKDAFHEEIATEAAPDEAGTGSSTER